MEWSGCDLAQQLDILQLRISSPPSCTITQPPSQPRNLDFEHVSIHCFLHSTPIAINKLPTMTNTAEMERLREMQNPLESQLQARYDGLLTKPNELLTKTSELKTRCSELEIFSVVLNQQRPTQISSLCPQRPLTTQKASTRF